MGSHIVEITSASNIGLQAPGQWFMIGDGIKIGLTRGFGITYLHVQNLTYCTTFNNILNFLEIRQISTIICTETRYTCLLAYAIDTGAILVACGQWFLNIYWLARLHSHDGISGVTRRRCGHIYSIDIRIVYHLLSIGIPFGDAMLNGIGTRMNLGATHYGYHT